MSAFHPLQRDVALGRVRNDERRDMTSAAVSAERRSILIVDDDPDIRLVLEEVFREEGFAVVSAHNGAAAIRVLSWLEPTVILLDIHMPIMDGVAFATAYQARSGPHAPIVVFSTAAESSRVKAIAPASVVTKPCDLDALIATVEKLSA